LHGKILISSTSQILFRQPKHTKEINCNLVPTTSSKVIINDTSPGGYYCRPDPNGDNNNNSLV
jgi:hypothetical protein